LQPEKYNALHIIGKDNKLQESTIIGGVKVEGDNNSISRSLIDLNNLNVNDAKQVRRIVKQLDFQLQESWKSLPEEKRKTKSKELKRLEKKIEASLSTNDSRKTSELLEELETLGTSP
jgi:hypothetical protein